MLKWLCESCKQYRPYTQQHCSCKLNNDSMFGDSWEEEEPQVRMVRKHSSDGDRKRVNNRITNHV